jgi:flagellar M-ring protein FliF
MADEDKAERSGISGQALAVIGRGQKLLEKMPQKKKTGLLAGVLLILALISGMAWLANRTEWKVLYSGMESRDSQLVQQELGAAGITFRMTGDGSSLEVPSELLDKARLEVAAKGMPQSGRLGFELFDKPNWVGSEFDEKVNYQRALEGELEHTIGTLGTVRSARVHLVMPTESLFSEEHKVAKASVVLKLRHPELSEEAALSMRRLVASAVENLSPEDVTLVDGDGRLDLSPRSGKPRDGETEQATEAKLVSMLEPTVGEGNVRAVVKATYDEGQEEKQDEVYDPTQTATVQMEKKEQLNGTAVKPSGVPGTASNTPAAAPVGAVQGSLAAAAPGVPPLLQGGTDGLPVYPMRGYGQNESIHEETGSYAVTKHSVHREDSPGRLSRITVAVVVNDRQTLEGAGKTAHMVWKPRSSEEMHRLEGLAQAAVGFDTKRGDSVVVENVSFSANTVAATETVADKSIKQLKQLLQDDPGATRQMVFGLLGILVVLFVLRPVARQVVAALEEPKPLPEPVVAIPELTAGELELKALMEAKERSFQAVAEDKLSEEQKQKVVVQAVAGHINRKPQQSTKLLEGWINAPPEVS